MISIAAIALVLTALRPIVPALSTAYPALGSLIDRAATFETGVVLSCLVVGLFVTMKMMSMDENG